MKSPSIIELVARFSALGMKAPIIGEETSFSKLSPEAREAIIWAVLSDDKESPPQLSDAVKEEIRKWAGEPDQT